MKVHSVKSYNGEIGFAEREKLKGTTRFLFFRLSNIYLSDGISSECHECSSFHFEYTWRPTCFGLRQAKLVILLTW